MSQDEGDENSSDDYQVLISLNDPRFNDQDLGAQTEMAQNIYNLTQFILNGGQFGG